MREFIIIDIQWNAWNGFYFQLLGIEFKDFQGSLLSFWADNKRVEMDIFFIGIRFYNPFKKSES